MHLVDIEKLLQNEYALANIGFKSLQYSRERALQHCQDLEFVGTFCRICENAEMEGELEKISMTVVKSYELKG